MTDITTLMQECENLIYGDRMKKMVEIGRLSKSNPQIQQTIENLFSGSLYQKYMALMTCHGSRDVLPAMALLPSSSRILRKSAFVVVAQIGSDSELLKALESPSLYSKYECVSWLRHRSKNHQRAKIIDNFLLSLEGKSENYLLLRDLLPYGSKDVIQKLFPIVFRRANALFWKRLAKHQPATTQSLLYEQINKSNIDDHQLLETVNQVLTTWSSEASSANVGLELLNFALRIFSLSQVSSRSIRKLASNKPNEIAKLILASNAKIEVDFDDKGLRNLSIEHLISLYHIYQKELVNESSFDELTSKQRVALYQVIRERWRSSGGILYIHVVSSLPSAERVTEARRHLELETFKANASNAIPYIALLSWDESISLQNKFIRSSKADERSSSLFAQIESVKYDRHRLKDALELALKAENDQDPVRTSVVRGLCTLPGSYWEIDHLSKTALIFRQALNASDLSSNTVSELLDLLAKLLPIYPQWAVSQFVLMWKERGPLDMPDCHHLGNASSAKDIMRIVADGMAPILGDLLKPEDVTKAVNMGQAFEPHLRYWGELRDVLFEALEMVDISYSRSELIGILKDCDPERFWIIAPKILHLLDEEDLYCDDTVSSFLRAIHKYQQPLLEPYIKPNDDPDTDSWIILQLLHFESGFERWSVLQQDLYSQKLYQYVMDETTPHQKKQTRVKQLGKLRFLDPEFLLQLSNNEHPVICDAAIRALGRVDGDQALETMLPALQGEKARVVIYALRSKLKRMLPERALEILESVPMTQVTVAKEVVRLIGDVQPRDSAFKKILELNEQQLHHSVRLEALKALWSYLEAPETWQIYRKAAGETDLDIIMAVLETPLDGASERTRQQFLEIYLIILNTPSQETRLKALVFDTKFMHYNQDPTLRKKLMQILEPATGVEIVRTLIFVLKMYSKAQPSALADMYQMYLKNRQSLVRLHAKYLDHIASVGCEQVLPASRLVMGVLETDPLTVSLRLKLMFRAFLWEEFCIHFRAIIDSLHADSVALSVKLISDYPWVISTDKVRDLELELAVDKRETARRLALALLVARVKQEALWTDESLSRLETFRTDSSLLVAEAAAFVFPLS